MTEFRTGLLKAACLSAALMGATATVMVVAFADPVHAAGVATAMATERVTAAGTLAETAAETETATRAEMAAERGRQRQFAGRRQFG